MEKAKLGGIFSIVSGAFGIFYLVFALFFAFFFNSFLTESGFWGGEISTEDFGQIMSIMTLIYTAIGVFYALLGALAVIGGICALRKKAWGLALAGAIAGSMVFFPGGIVAVIFSSMAKPEFNVPAPQTN